jgi:hypothetical protein
MTDEAPGEDEDAPHVILATIADLGRWVPQDVSRRYGDRPVWFILEMDAELVSVFERLPEDPMPRSASDRVLAVLRAFATDKSDDLQRVLGVTDGIQYGFHVDATREKVRACFEEDGFLVMGTVEDGEVVVLDDQGFLGGG